MQALQAASLMVLFTSLAFRLSERSEESEPEGFPQQLSESLLIPYPTLEVQNRAQGWGI